MSCVTPTNSRPSTPNHVLRTNYYSPAPSSVNNGLAGAHHSSPQVALSSLTATAATSGSTTAAATASPSHKEQISKDPSSRETTTSLQSDRLERLTPSVNLGINTAVWNVGNNNNSTSSLLSASPGIQTGNNSQHLSGNSGPHLTGNSSQHPIGNSSQHLTGSSGYSTGNSGQHLTGSGGFQIGNSFNPTANSYHQTGSSVGGGLQTGNSFHQTGSSLLSIGGGGGGGVGYGVVGTACSGSSSTGTGSLAGSGSGSTGSVSGLGHAAAAPGALPVGGVTDTQPSPPILFVDAVLLPPPPPIASSGAVTAATTSSSSSSKEQKDLPTPSSTPTTSRKARRRSNLFTVGSLPSKKADDNKKVKNGEVGSGRVIPLKQGYLYKRSCKALNKEWKKKYVSLCEDGRLTYHPNLNDYMDDVHGKEIPLKHTTVKIPGQRPRGTKTQISQTSTSSSHVNGLDREIGSLSIGGGFHFNLPVFGKDKSSDKDVQLTTYEMHRDGGSFKPGSFSGPCDDAVVIPNSGVLNGSDSTQSNNAILGKIETPNVKKRHRRMKSSGGKNLDNFDDSNGYEFIVVSLDNKQWHFDAASIDERDSWVQAIEQRILNSLQCNESSKSKSRMNSLVDAAAIQSMKTAVGGNTHCVDCDAPNPDWASLNLGSLVCIECSGIHRNLGSHISRIRSLDLDEWSPWHIKVMLSIGNTMANAIYEENTRGLAKPTPNSSREEKERWIRSKYERKDFLRPLGPGAPLVQQLVDSIRASDIKSVVYLLAHSTPEHVNTPVSARDARIPLHFAAALGNVSATQLLLWNNSNVKAMDQEGRTALTFARLSGSTDVQELLVQSGCPESQAPVSGTLPRRKGSIGRNNPEVFDKLPASVI